MNNILLIIILTILIELITLFARFIIKVSSKETIIKIMKKHNFKHFIHFHHGILGIMLTFISIYFGFQLLLDAGISLIFSDAIHHLFVLWPIIGHPEFHLIYKNKKYFKKKQIEEDKKIKKFIRHLIPRV